MCLVLALDEFTKLLFDAFGCKGISIETADGTVEEEFQLKKTLRRIHILIGGNPTYRGFMHLDVLCHIAEHERFEMRNSLVKELFLKMDDTLGYSKQGPLALVNALYQPRGGSHLFLDIGLCVLRNRDLVLENFFVIAINPQFGQSVLILYDFVIITGLENINIRSNIDGLLI